MEIISGHDILIIGGGAAGLRAAIEAASSHQKLNVAVISKVYPTRSHTVTAEGGIAAVMKEDDSREEHAIDTIKGGDYLGDQDAVRFFVDHCRDEIETLNEWGCPWSRDKNGDIAVRAFGGMSKKRTVYAADRVGFFLLHNLFERTLRYENIRRYDEWFVMSLIKEEDRITGAVALQLKTGKIHAFRAGAVIICTGGAGKLYKNTTNSAIKTGDGMALALNAGAKLKDMEFVQFHPTALPKTGILITEAARGEGGWLVNKDGERFLKKYAPEKMELGPRDIISRAIISEYRDGKGFTGAFGHYMELDIRHLGEKKIQEKLPQVRELAMEYMGIDPVKEPIPVTPAQHYCMGGIDTNIAGETSLKGLYAAGETACVSINGANRLGSNSLAECLVFGKEAGKNAALHAMKNRPGADGEKTAGEHAKLEIIRLRKIMAQKGDMSVAAVRDDLELLMEQGAGIVRNEKKLLESIQNLEDVESKSKKISLADRGTIFNGELIQTIELEGMIRIARCVLASALARKESRGAHYREDYPARNDHEYLHHQTISMQNGELNREKKTVILTEWKVAERKY